MSLTTFLNRCAGTGTTTALCKLFKILHVEETRPTYLLVAKAQRADALWREQGLDRRWVVSLAELDRDQGRPPGIVLCDTDVLWHLADAATKLKDEIVRQGRHIAALKTEAQAWANKATALKIKLSRVAGLLDELAVALPDIAPWLDELRATAAQATPPTMSLNDELNALSPRLRQYFHDLSACSASELVQEVGSLTEQRDALVVLVKELQDQAAEIDRRAIHASFIPLSAFDSDK